MYESGDRMKTRALSGILILTVLVLSIYFSSKIFAVVMLLCAEMGLYEFINIKYGKDSHSIEFIKFISYILLGAMVLNNIFYKIDDSIILITSILGLTLPIIFYNDSKKYNISDALFMVGVIIFLGFSFGTIIHLRDISIYKCIYIFIVAFVADTYAYIGGYLIGKHKLTNISPKKTIEGSVVGTLMGTVIGSLYYYSMFGETSLVFIVIMSFVLTLLSEFGDLVFSSIKRYFGKKDYSNLIPGHGGILDRFDSVIFVALGLALILNFL